MIISLANLIRRQNSHANHRRPHGPEPSNGVSTHCIFHILVLTLLVFTSVAKSQPQQSPAILRSPILLHINEQRLVQIQNISRFSLGSNIAKAISPKKIGATSKNQILLRGQKRGSTDLMVWKQDGTIEKRQITVLPNAKPSKLDGEIAQSLALLTTVEIVPAGKKYILDGEISSLKDFRLISFITNEYSEHIENRTHPSRALLQSVYDKIKLWISAISISGVDIKIKKLGSELLLSGHVPDKKIYDLILNQFLNLFPFVKIQIEYLGKEAYPIHLSIFMIEVLKKDSQDLGISWDAQQNDFITLTKNKIQTLLDLKSVLNVHRSNGSLKVISNPQINALCPGKADFFAGGSLPITDKTQYSSKTDWKEFGLKVDVELKKKTKDQIFFEITSKFSTIDPKSDKNDHPSFLSNKLHTEIIGKIDSPIFLSGLLQRKIKKIISEFPFFADIPVIGELFRSESFQEDKSELVIAIVPSNESPSIEKSSIRQFLRNERDLNPIDLIEWDSIYDKTDETGYPWKYLD